MTTTGPRTLSAIPWLNRHSCQGSRRYQIHARIHILVGYADPVPKPLVSTITHIVTTTFGTMQVCITKLRQIVPTALIRPQKLSHSIMFALAPTMVHPNLPPRPPSSLSLTRFIVSCRSQKTGTTASCHPEIIFRPLHSFSSGIQIRLLAPTFRLINRTSTDRLSTRDFWRENANRSQLP